MTPLVLSCKRNYNQMAFLFAFIMSIFAVMPMVSAQPACPKKIGYLQGLTVNSLLVPHLKEHYQKVGCTPEFVSLPGRRSIASFNTGRIDGEIARLEIAEKHYKRDFVRSQTPVLILEPGIWSHPNRTEDFEKSIGFVLGIPWMESYAQNKENARSFQTIDEMFKKYNAGIISGFLAPFELVNHYKKRQGFALPPVRIRTVTKEPLYHYLSSEFAPIMHVLSDSLKENPISLSQDPPNIGNGSGDCDRVC